MGYKFKTSIIIASLLTLMLFYTNCAPSFESYSSGDEDSSFSETNPFGDSSGVPYEAESIIDYEKLTDMTDLRLLSNREIISSLKQAFGSSLPSVNNFTPSLLFEPFDNMDGNPISGVLVEYIYNFSSKFSNEFVNNSSLMAKYNSCSGINGNKTCITTFINRVGQIFFRRPLTTTETNNFFSLVQNLDSSLNVKSSIDVLLQTFVQDAAFLYKWELGNTKVRDVGVYTYHSLDIYEYMSRISFFLTGRSPSEELLNQIKQGHFSSVDKIEAYIRSTQKTEAYKEQMLLFFSAWLGFEHYKDKDLNSLSAHKYKESAELVNASIFLGTKDWRRVFTSKQTRITKKLADIYGVKINGDEAWHTYQRDDQMGYLSQLSFLASASIRGDSSTTRRGYHLHKRLFCGAPAPLPPGIDPAEDPAEGLDTNCKIERVEQSLLKSGSSCLGCHINFENLAFGLENYGLDGRYRTHQKGDPNCKITGEGSIPALGKSFNGINGLVKVGLETNAFEKCMALHIVELGVGLDAHTTKTALISYSQKILKENDHNFEVFVNKLLLSNEFRYSARGSQ